MRKLFRSFECWLKQLNLFYFVIIILLLTYLAAILAGLIIILLDIEDIVWSTRDFGDFGKIILTSLSAIIIAPPLETLIFQYIPTDLLSEKPFFKKRPYLLVLISAFCFGLVHSYFSPGYAIFAFTLGLVLMWGCVIRYKAKKQAFIATWLVHLIRNVIAMSISIYKIYLA